MGMNGGQLRPFFPFYGGKWRAARLYGPPLYFHVIEPFAGSAGYATYWGARSARLYEADEIIVGVWDYLIHASEREVLALPDLELGMSTDDLRVCPEARNLIGFWINRGSATPKKTRTAYSARTDKAQLIWGVAARDRIARQLEAIRNWRVSLDSYADAFCYRATWFIDPPYVERGRYYRKHAVDL